MGRAGRFCEAAQVVEGAGGFWGRGRTRGEKRQKANCKRQKAKIKAEDIFEDTSAGGEFHRCSEPAAGEYDSPTAGMYQILPGGLSGRLAEEVNRRPLFRRAGHRLGQPLGSGLSIDRLPVPLLFFSGHPKTAPIQKAASPKRRTAGGATPNYGARGPTLAIPILS